MNTAHTPGPWVLEEWHSDYGPTGDFSVYATGVKRKFPIASIQEPFNGKKTKANAHLISAAPELLAVAKKIKAHGTLSASWIEELDTAIAKATGAAA